MQLRFFSIFLTLLLISGCVSYKHLKSSSPTLPSTEKSSQKIRPMPSFNEVEVTGPLNVLLRTGYKKPAVILRGSKPFFKKVQTKVKSSRLIVEASKKGYCCGQMTLEIHAPNLNLFKYDGEGVVKGPNLHSSLLDLDINNTGSTTLGGSIFIRKLKVNGGGILKLNGLRTRSLDLDLTGATRLSLSGNLTVSKINLKGNGILSMYWIKSPYLTVCAKGNAKIQLAGYVEKLDVELWGKSLFNGRYLRAFNAYVKTHDAAVASITVLKHQHALATDASDIYFYKIPETKADFMAYQGSILDMRDWNIPDLKDYDRFNKETH